MTLPNTTASLECPLQRIARETLDKCDSLEVASPRARAEAVAVALAKSGLPGSRSAAHLVDRLLDASIK